MTIYQCVLQASENKLQAESEQAYRRVEALYWSFFVVFFF